MHVLYIVGQNKGGLPHYAAELANAVAESEQVTVLKPSTTTADDVFSNKVTVKSIFKPMNLSWYDLFSMNFYPVENARGLLSYRNLSIINDIDPDIVHDPTDLFPQVKFFLWRNRISKSHPLVVTTHEVSARGEHGGDSLISAATVIDFIESSIPGPTREKTIVHTDHQKDWLSKRGIPPEDIEIIPHGTYEMFKDYSQEASEEENTLLFFGQIIPRKGLDTLVESAPYLIERFPDLNIIIAGAGDISEKSRSIIKSYEKNFELHNKFVENEKVGELFRRAQIVVLPYMDRPQPSYSGCLAIAQSFGKPIVATNVRPLPELVGRHGCGMIVPPEDPEALSDSTTTLLENGKLRRQMAKESKRRGKELSWANIAKKHIKLYESIIKSE